jgi:trans-aconitate 2-methyltransferase
MHYAAFMADWNPEKYLAFADERARPALDLIARIPNREPRLIHDLGCGPGNSTRLLRDAFPDAQISAIDSSPAMIAKAKASGVEAEFSTADVTQWTPNPDADLVFSNALFQWVPQHDRQLRRIFTTLKSGAILALQMPDNLREPSHQLMPQVAQAYVSKAESDQIVSSRSSLLASSGYVELLQSGAKHVDVWRTTYHHRLKSRRAIADMFSTTGLKPWLDAIDRQSTDEFLAAYVKAIAPHYPPMQDGNVLYPFPRLFILAVKA